MRLSRFSVVFWAIAISYLSTFNATCPDAYGCCWESWSSNSQPVAYCPTCDWQVYDYTYSCNGDCSGTCEFICSEEKIVQMVVPFDNSTCGATGNCTQGPIEFVYDLADGCCTCQ